jgi:mRNA deadenylase 3'-5' endonuclease subunit Ccr4
MDSGQHPTYTNYTEGFQGTLDYIFHTPYLEVVELRPIPSEDVVTAEIALPNTQFPSDHLPIQAKLRLL